MPALEELIKIVRENAREILLPAFGQVQARTKADGSLVTKADLDMSQRIQEILQEKYPAVEFLSEEMSHEEHLALIKTSKPLWILDPLDGTTNFANGIPFFAVSLALIENAEVKFGIIYDPIRDECFTAEKNQPSRCNGELISRPVVPEKLKDCVATIDFKRLTLDLRTKIVEEIPYTSQRSFGSGALDWCWLAMGRGHIYLHGRQNVWDYIVGQMILQQAHGKCCKLDGAVVFSGEFKASSAVAAATPELFEQWCDWLGVSR